MISALSWIPRGVAKLKLEHIADDDEHALQAMKLYGSAEANVATDGHSDLTEDMDDMMSDENSDDVNSSDSNGNGDGGGSNLPGDDIARAKRFAALLKSDAAKSAGSAQESKGAKGAQQISNSLAELNMDAYDDEDDGDEEMNRILGGGNPGMAYYADPSDDPYLNKDDQSDSEDEIEYRETDLLIAAARNEEDISHLEIWVYEEGTEQNPDGNIYIHHSLLLPAFPLCLAWGPCDPTSGTVGGNFMAVGSFEPGIEIWNLDVVDAVEPVATLGGADYEAARTNQANGVAGSATSKKGNKGKKKGATPAPPEIPVRPGSHKDAVLGLAWNQEYCNVLASGSADHTVKIWDVTTQQPTQTLTLHGDKVQAVKWRPVEASLLLSGGYDRRLFLSDLRAPDAGASSWNIDSDVESVAWNPHDPHTFAVSSEDGRVTLFDTRKTAALESFHAHKKAVTSVSFCPCLDGVMVTGSTDGRAKVWKRTDDGKGFAEMACEKMGVGAIFSAEYCRDAPMLVAVGGAEGTCSVWDTHVAIA